MSTKSTANWLTTADAEEQNEFPAKTFAAWCREGKIAGARKVDGEWLMPAEGVAAFLQANPQFKPPERNVAVQIPGWLWQALGVVALVVGFIADVYAVRDIIRGGDRTVLWIIIAVFSACLWISAIIVLTAKRRRGFLRWKRNQPVYRETRRYTSRRVRLAAWAAVIAMPVFLILGIVGYNVWRVIPPRQTVVLVADFVTPDGQDSDDVTEKLVKNMRDTLAGHPNIKVKRLNRPITEEEGSKQARAIGSRPEHKAAFVIWGDYVLEPEPEMYVHFDILRQVEIYLGSGTYEEYGPSQIRQPSMFDFKLKLGSYLGQLTALANGLALFDAGSYKEAIPFFDTAAEAIGQPLAAKRERVIRFYRGTTFLVLNRALDAKADLAALVPDQGSPIQAFDELALAALGHLGLVARHQGDYAAAKTYLEQALAIDRQLGNLLGEASDLGNLGVVALDQGDYAAAKAYLEQALAVFQQLGDTRGIAAGLGDLGLVARQQGDYAAAKAYHEQALAIHRQLGDLLGEATALNNLGLVAQRQGDYAAAKAYYEQALAIDRQLGDTLGEAAALGNLGAVAYDQGDYAAAKSYWEQVLALCRQLGNPLGEAATLGNLGAVAYDQGDYAAAKAYHEQALAIDRQLGDTLGEADDLTNLGAVARDQGDYAAAKAYLEQALAIDRQLGYTLEEAVALNNLGLVAQRQGDYAAAKGYHEQALAIDRRLGYLLGEAHDLGNLGVAALGQRDYAAAKAYLEQALALFRQLGNLLGEAASLGNLGVVAYNQGDAAAAKAYMEQSIQIYQQIGVPAPEVLQSAFDSLSAP